MGLLGAPAERRAPARGGGHRRAAPGARAAGRGARRRRPRPLRGQDPARRRGLVDVRRRHLRAALPQRGTADRGLRGDELRPAGRGHGGGRHARDRPRRRDRHPDPAGGRARSRRGARRGSWTTRSWPPACPRRPCGSGGRSTRGRPTRAAWWASTRRPPRERRRSARDRPPGVGPQRPRASSAAWPAPGVRVIACDHDPAALGLLSRYATPVLMADPLTAPDAFIDDLHRPGPRPGRRRGALPDPRRGDRDDRPARGRGGRRPAPPLEPVGHDEPHHRQGAPARDGAQHRLPRPGHGGAGAGRGHRRGRPRPALPGDPQAALLARVPAAVRRPGARGERSRRAAGRVGDGGRVPAPALRGDPGRGLADLDPGQLPGRRRARAGLVHRAQAAPVAAALRHRPLVRVALGRGLRRARPRAARRPGLPRHLAAGGEARPARRARLPHRGQPALVAVDRPRHQVRGQPALRGVARRRRAAAAAHRRAPQRRPLDAGDQAPRGQRARDPARAPGARAPSWRTIRPPLVDGVFDLRDPTPMLALYRRSIGRRG